MGEQHETSNNICKALGKMRKIVGGIFDVPSSIGEREVCTSHDWKSNLVEICMARSSVLALIVYPLQAILPLRYVYALCIMYLMYVAEMPAMCGGNDMTIEIRFGHRAPVRSRPRMK